MNVTDWLACAVLGAAATIAAAALFGPWIAEAVATRVRGRRAASMPGPGAEVSAPLPTDARALLRDAMDAIPNAAPVAYEHTAIALAALCEQLGHEPVVDQCSQPEHDYCAWCLKLMPGQATRR